MIVENTMIVEPGEFGSGVFKDSPVLCISTSFRVLRAPKSLLKYFFSAGFNLFCSLQTFFSDFTPEINKKRWKKNKKKH